LLTLLGSIRGRIIRMIIASSVSSSAAVALAVVAGRAAGHLARRDGTLWWLAGCAAALGVFEFATTSWQEVQASLASAWTFRRTRTQLLHAVHQHGPGLSPAAAPEALLGLATTDAESLDVLINLCGSLGGALFGAAITVVAAATISGWLVLLVVIAATLAASVVARSSHALFDAAWTHHAATQRVTAMMSTIMDGRETVAGLSLQTALSNVARTTARTAMKAGIEHNRSTARAEMAGRLTGVGVVLGTAGLVVLRSGTDGWTAREAITAIGLVASLTPMLTLIALAVGQVLGARATASRLLEVLGAEARRPLSCATAPSVDDAIVHIRNGSVHAEGFSARPVLHDIALDVHAGEVVAICGATGSGKTTLLRLVEGSVSGAGGVVRVDGVDPFELSVDDRRRIVALAEQHPFLYDDTLRSNLSVATVDESRQRSALQRAAADDLAAMVGDRPLGRAGQAVSGGQRRRLVLARAMASAAHVVLLDDPTASLDPSTATRVAVGLRRSGRTMLVASNDPAVLCIADRVVLLAGGTIVAVGRHDELLSDEPAYRQLAEADFIDPQAGE
jgi:ABC-type multidrug transport system fused ATPase/permease subunit